MKLALSLVPEEVRGLSQDDRAILAEILNDLAKAVEGIRRAALKWVALSGAARRRILAETPPTWRFYLQKLQRVGEGTLHPQLYHAAGLAARYLGRLPLPEQERYLRERIPVVTLDGRGRTDERLMDVEEMDDGERQQVFKTAGDTVVVRTPEEQRAWLEERARRKAEAEARHIGDVDVVRRPGRWRVERGHIYVEPEKAKSGLTLRDVRTMLKDLGGDV